MDIPRKILEDKPKQIKKQEKEELKGLKGQDRYFIKQCFQAMKKPLEEILNETNTQ